MYKSCTHKSASEDHSTAESQWNKLKQAFESKYADGGEDPSDRLFYNMLMEWIEYSRIHAKTNKDRYFCGNQKLHFVGAIRRGAGHAGQLLVKAGAGVTVCTVVLYPFLKNLPLVDHLWPVLVLLLITGVAFVAYKDYRESHNLMLSRYGETWIRHTVTFSKYQQEMICFVCGLPPYTMGAKDNRRELQKRTLVIYENNIRSFQKNMENLEELIK